MTPQKGMQTKHLSWRLRPLERRSRSKARPQWVEMFNSIVGVSAERRHCRKTNLTELKRQKAQKDLGKAQAYITESSQVHQSWVKAQSPLALAQHQVKTALSCSNRVRVEFYQKTLMKSWKRRSQASIWKLKDALKIPRWPKASTSRQ